MYGAAMQRSADVELQPMLPDGISSLAFSPRQNYLSAGCWDSQVRCWEILPTGQGTAKVSYPHDGPVLCVGWSGDGQRLLSGGCDAKVRSFNVAVGRAEVVGQHQAPVRQVQWVEEQQAIATGGWDSTLCLWDSRVGAQAPVLRSVLPNRCFAMDVKSPLCVVATAEKHVVIVDLRKPQIFYKQFFSPLKCQTRAVACFLDRSGFAIGSTEGRCGIHHVEDKDQSRNFSFKCHRHAADIFAVNVISFHPRYGTFATAGSDGTFNFWDKDSKQRLKDFPRQPFPISAGGFNMNGTLFAYAVSYDWSMGQEHYNPQTQKNSIWLHAVLDDEIRNRRRTTRGGRR